MSLEANKIAGAILLAGVVTMGAGYAGDILVGSGKHHGDDHSVAYPLVMPEGDDHSGDKKVVVEEVLAPVLPLLASADVAAGEKTFKKCSACHNVNEGGKNGQGPALWNIVGREIASVEGFKYGGLADVETEVWSYEALNGFLNAPKKWAPGTKMNYKGLSKVQDRADLIAYLRAQAPEPKALEAFE